MKNKKVVFTVVVVLIFVLISCDFDHSGGRDADFGPVTIVHAGNIPGSWKKSETYTLETPTKSTVEQTVVIFEILPSLEYTRKEIVSTVTTPPSVHDGVDYYCARGTISLNGDGTMTITETQYSLVQNPSASDWYVTNSTVTDSCVFIDGNLYISNVFTRDSKGKNLNGTWKNVCTETSTFGTEIFYTVMVIDSDSITMAKPNYDGNGSVFDFSYEFVTNTMITRFVKQWYEFVHTVCIQC